MVARVAATVGRAFHLAHRTVEVHDADAERRRQKVVPEEISMSVGVHDRMIPIVVVDLDPRDPRVPSGSCDAKLGVAGKAVGTGALVVDVAVAKATFSRAGYRGAARQDGA